VDVREFDFDLPPELIAQEPPAARGSSRLLHLDRATGAIAHLRIDALPALLRAGDLLVVNNTKVFPARLLGRREPSGGAVECLLIRCQARAWHVPGTCLAPDGTKSAEWEALMHPGQKLHPGSRVVFEGIHTIHGEVLERRFFGG
jgi:S-adenosylmethionine:tRNA ribosyltransferase-isomerase